MSPAGASQNERCLYLYLPNWHANIVRYNDLSSNFRLWYLELASMIDIYLILLSFGNMLFSMGPLCIALINAKFICAGSKHSLTLLLALDASTKLLDHSNISFTPSGAIISCCCSLSNSSLNGFCSAYATRLGSTWYGLLSGFSCKETVPSKHTMPLNIGFLGAACVYVLLTLFHILSIYRVNV